MKKCRLLARCCASLKSPKQTLVEGAPKAKIVGAASLASVALAGAIEDRDAVAPVNAISHIVWGDEAYEQRELSLKYTGTAVLLNDVSVAGWAYLHEWLFGKAQDEGKIGTSLVGGAAISLLAYLIDYHLVPKRFKPGFERHLQPKSLVFIYVILALALGLGGFLTGRGKRN